MNYTMDKVEIKDDEPKGMKSRLQGGGLFLKDTGEQLKFGDSLDSSKQPGPHDAMIGLEKQQ